MSHVCSCSCKFRCSNSCSFERVYIFLFRSSSPPTRAPRPSGLWPESDSSATAAHPTSPWPHPHGQTLPSQLPCCWFAGLSPSVPHGEGPIRAQRQLLRSNRRLCTLRLGRHSLRTAGALDSQKWLVQFGGSDMHSEAL